VLVEELGNIGFTLITLGLRAIIVQLELEILLQAYIVNLSASFCNSIEDP
jgi:hypothetical protein